MVCVFMCVCHPRTACYTFGLKQWEHALVVNLMPETPEEACTLIPSLKASITHAHTGKQANRQTERQTDR